MPPTDKPITDAELEEWNAQERWLSDPEWRIVRRLIADVKRLQKELAEHHCDSCDGSAPTCR